MRPRPKFQCGTALVLNSKTQLADVMHCVLDRAPHHSFHLLMDPLQAQKLGVEERAEVIAKFTKLPEVVESKRPKRKRAAP